VKNNSGWLADSIDDLVEIFNKVRLDSQLLKIMGKASYYTAIKLLDYRVLAARLYK